MSPRTMNAPGSTAATPPTVPTPPRVSVLGVWFGEGWEEGGGEEEGERGGPGP